MPNFRPGSRDDCFEDRCLKTAVLKACECLGDRLRLEGDCETRCWVWNRVPFKHEDLGERQIVDSDITMYWPTCEKRRVVCGSVINRKGKRYDVSEDPVDLYNGWTCAPLNYCGLC